MLCGVDGSLCSQPVWTFAKHRKGFSLKLFWGWLPPNGDHSDAPSKRTSRSRRRMEAFLLKKKAGSPSSSEQHVASGSQLGTSGIPYVPTGEDHDSVTPMTATDISVGTAKGCGSEQSSVATMVCSASVDVDAESCPTPVALKLPDVSPVAKHTRSKSVVPLVSVTKLLMPRQPLLNQATVARQSAPECD